MKARLQQTDGLWGVIYNEEFVVVDESFAVADMVCDALNGIEQLNEFGGPTECQEVANSILDRFLKGKGGVMEKKEPKVIIVCDNCGAMGDAGGFIPLDKIEDLGERLEAGQEVPAGECRSCGALSYLSNKTITKATLCLTIKSDQVVNHLDVARSVQEYLWETYNQDGSLMDVSVISAEGSEPPKQE